jgi:hypothetical protein
MIFAVYLFFNPFEVAKYMSSTLGELLTLLVLHHARLNELHGNGNFRSSEYLRHQNNIEQIQKAIKVVTDRQSLPQPST